VAVWRGLKVGLTIIGTTIGAGFASGREMWEFFTSYGRESQYSLSLAMFLFFITVTIVLWMSANPEITNYYGILRKLMGKKLASIFDILTMLYLLSMSIVMFAGSGATFSEWNFSYTFGVIFIALTVFLVLLFDVDGLMSIQSFIIPILTGVLLFVYIKFLTGDYEGAQTILGNGYVSWPSGITYAALNVVPLIAVVSTLGKELRSKKEIWVSSLVSTGGLALIALLMNSSLLKAGHEIGLYEIPLFALLKGYPTAMIAVVSVILWFAIYTTALSGVYGIVSRISSWFKSPNWLISLVLILMMIPLSNFGFSTLVAVLYPIYGVLNLFVLALIILYPISYKTEK